eukprot:GHVL01013230.1.p1 GENE.GHVL01013230.1~~GHVL01013230.1.p1  ORF type:complete len:537 (-),score=194.99 GHVL01013230.1:1363-2973(-)
MELYIQEMELYIQEYLRRLYNKMIIIFECNLNTSQLPDHHIKIYKSIWDLRTHMEYFNKNMNNNELFENNKNMNNNSNEFVQKNDKKMNSNEFFEKNMNINSNEFVQKNDKKMNSTCACLVMTSVVSAKMPPLADEENINKYVDDENVDESDNESISSDGTYDIQKRRKRFRLFSKFDKGIIIDDSAWYECTPEKIATHISHIFSNINLLIEGCCGIGGNTCQFALNNSIKNIISIDILYNKIKIAKNNCSVYNINDNRVDFIVADFFDFVDYYPSAPPGVNHTGWKNKDPVDAVFLSPPWGGPSYKISETFSLKQVLVPDICNMILAAARLKPYKIVCFLPKNCHLGELLHIGYEIGYPIINIQKLFCPTLIGSLIIYSYSYNELLKSFIKPFKRISIKKEIKKKNKKIENKQKKQNLYEIDENEEDIKNDEFIEENIKINNEINKNELIDWNQINISYDKGKYQLNIPKISINIPCSVRRSENRKGIVILKKHSIKMRYINNIRSNRNSDEIRNDLMVEISLALNSWTSIWVDL